MALFDPFDELVISSEAREIYLMKSPHREKELNEMLPLATVREICKAFPNLELLHLGLIKHVPWWSSTVNISGYAVINDPRFYRLNKTKYGRYMEISTENVRYHQERLDLRIPEPEYFNVLGAYVQLPRWAITNKSLNDYLAELVTQSSKEYLEWRD